MRVIATVIGPLKKHVGMYQWTVDWLQSMESLRKLFSLSNTIKIFQEKLWWSLSWTDMTVSQLTPRWFCKLSFFMACHWLPNRFIRQQIVAKSHHHQVAKICENECIGFNVTNCRERTISVEKGGQSVATLSVWATVRMDDDPVKNPYWDPRVFYWIIVPEREINVSSFADQGLCLRWEGTVCWI